MTSSELSMCQQLYPHLTKLIFSQFGSNQITTRAKADDSLVTQVDEQIDALISQAIKDNFPDDDIMSEEGSPNEQITDQRLWVVDPICGTHNFAYGVLFFTTNIVLFQDQKPIFAFVVDYPKQTFYWTDHQSHRVFNQNTPVTSYPPTKLKQVVIDPAYLPNLDSPPDQKLALGNIYGDLVSQGVFVANPASSLAHTYTAFGQYDGLISPRLMPWDFSAACYFFEKNGGAVTDMYGQPWGLHSTGIVASLSRDIHARLLEVVSKHWPL